MDLERIVRALQDPDAYPHPVDAPIVHHTHISVVFLAGPFAYKVKKPVDLGFLDFTTLEKRRHFCGEEVRLNRRLAPDVYLDVVPLVERDGGLRVGGAGEPVEYAVKMRRLPEEATALRRLERGELEEEELKRLAARIADFHAGAAGGERVARFGRFEVVAGNARENFRQSREQAGPVVDPPVLERAERLTEAALDRHRERIVARADAGVPRDTHGDLHLDHVYILRERGPGADLVVIDCIEFNERFRYADPISDMAFLAMDLAFRGRRDLSETFTAAYLEASGDREGAGLVPFYRAYRAAVRGKVEGMTALDEEVPAETRRRARERARAYWLLSLGELEEPGRRPCLVLVGGLPGTGKSTLAAGLGRRAGFQVLSSDEVRKELAGVPEGGGGAAPYGEGIYAPAWTERTYSALRDRARERVASGRRVLVDASFHDEERRLAFLEVAKRLSVPVLFLVCEADPEVVEERLRSRRGGASDAGPSVYRQMARRWQAPGERTGRHARPVDTAVSPQESLDAAVELLRAEGLA
ncbi:MAG TPA: AAA family ATPase [Gemmatimonadota bacterium]|nr:AAA family ATPase [Gemmatimonadota bacterium]